jgi:hypothetical protein
MPPGRYTIKWVRAGAEPVTISNFILQSGYSNHDFSAKLEDQPNLKEDLQPQLIPKQ